MLLTTQKSYGNLVNNNSATAPENIVGKAGCGGNVDKGKSKYQVAVSSPLLWQICTSTAEESLSIMLESMGDVIVKDDPRFLAAVDTASLCGMMGVALWRTCVPGQRLLFFKGWLRSGDIYFNAVEADIIYDHLTRLENSCFKLKKRITSVFSHPHLRRVKELLTYLSTFYRNAKIDAAAMGTRQQGEGTPLIQKNMDDYVTPKKIEPFSNSKHQSGEDSRSSL